MDEITVVKTYLTSRLGGSATLAGLGLEVYDLAQVPQGAPVPYVGFFHQAGTSRGAAYGKHYMMVFTFQVRVTVLTGQGALANAAREEIIALLDDQKGVAVGVDGYVYGVSLRATLEYAEPMGTTGYFHSGGLFEIVAGVLN